jgi:hypothetical protein
LFVIVPFREDFTLTETPGIGFPDLASVILPEIVD